MNLSRLWSQNNGVNDTVTQIIENYGFPTRAQLAEQSGYNTPFLFEAFWLMYASSFGLRNKANKHAPTHYNDAATVANVRYSESSFRVTPEEISPGYLHEGEDVGKLLAGDKQEYALAATLAFIEVAHDLLARQSGVDFRRQLHLLTNMPGMLSYPVEKYFEAQFRPGVEFVVRREDLLARLDGLYSRFHISKKRIGTFYRDLVRRWQNVDELTDSDKHSYLPPEEREYIHDTINSFIARTVRRKGKGGIIEPTEIDEVVLREFKLMREPITSNALVEFPRNLVLPHQAATLLDLRLTNYGRYIQHQNDAVEEDARTALVNGTTQQDDSYLSPAILKGMDARDVATRMINLRLEDKISIALKDRIILERDTALATTLRDIGANYERLWLAVNFLYSGLMGTLEQELADSGARESMQTIPHKDELEKLGYVKGLIREPMLPPAEHRLLSQIKPKVIKHSGLGYLFDLARRTTDSIF